MTEASSLETLTSPENDAKQPLSIGDFLLARDNEPNKLFTNGLLLIRENMTMVKAFPKTTVNIKSVIQIWRDETKHMWAILRCDDNAEQTPTHFDVIDFAKDRTLVSKRSEDTCNALVADAATKYPDKEEYLFITSPLRDPQSWARTKNVLNT